MSGSTPDRGLPAIHAAIRRLVSGEFLVTAANDGRRSGLIARSVQPVADDPVLLAVSVHRGHLIQPLIRDSRAFGLCFVAEGDRLIRRTFDPRLIRTTLEFSGEGDGEEDDPFAAFETVSLRSGSPILKKAKLAFDCEVVRHFDLEADHELFIGAVVAVVDGG
jgi:flavin reductase (DIM6/NTAB) family NADH-FMN oxidoreductase RutF